MGDITSISPYHLITKASMNTIAPLGLFIASNISKIAYGGITRTDYTNIKQFTKKLINDPKKILKDGIEPEYKNSLPKLISPILFMGSAIASVYINERNKKSHDQLRESVKNIEKFLTTQPDVGTG